MDVFADRRNVLGRVILLRGGIGKRQDGLLGSIERDRQRENAGDG